MSTVAGTSIPEVTASPAPTETSVSPTPTPKALAADPIKELASKDLGRISVMPNTATPWYNYIVVGSLLVLLFGTMLYRRIAAFRRE